MNSSFLHDNSIIKSQVTIQSNDSIPNNIIDKIKFSNQSSTLNKLGKRGIENSFDSVSSHPYLKPSISRMPRMSYQLSHQKEKQGSNVERDLAKINKYKHHRNNNSGFYMNS